MTLQPKNIDYGSLHLIAIVIVILAIYYFSGYFLQTKTRRVRYWEYKTQLLLLQLCNRMGSQPISDLAQVERYPIDVRLNSFETLLDGVGVAQDGWICVSKCDQLGKPFKRLNLCFCTNNIIAVEKVPCQVQLECFDDCKRSDTT